MKLGIGAKAGLASGIILSSMHAIGIIYFSLVRYSAAEPGVVIPPVFKDSIIAVAIATLFGILFVIILLSIEGYYYFLVRPKIYLLILLFIMYIVLGRIFQSLYIFLPTKSSAKNGIIYAITIWFLLGITALLLSFVGIRASAEEVQNFSTSAHIYNAIGWLLYGFLLGKFYDAFSKEPEAGILYMIKKVLLRKS